MTQVQSYDPNLGLALLDIELHKAYRTVFGRLRCEECGERCSKAGCMTRRVALAYVKTHASERDRRWYTSAPHGGLFSDTEVHEVLPSKAKTGAPAIPVPRPPSPIEQRRPQSHRRRRRPSPGPRPDRSHDYPMEPVAGAIA